MARIVVRPAAVVILAAAVVAAACNVFVTVSQCESDADCPSGATCDPDGRFCLKTVTEAAPPPPPPPPPIDASDADAPAPDVDAGPPTCDPLAPFTSFKIVAGLENVGIIGARFSPDETTVIISALNGAGCTDQSCYDMLTAHRDTRNDPFSAPVEAKLAPANCNQAADYWPTLSADGLFLAFESSRARVPDGGACGQDDRSRIWYTSRGKLIENFDPPHIDPLFDVPDGVADSTPFLHPDGRSLYFASIGRPGASGQGLFVATIDAQGLTQTISPLTAANETGKENFPVISLDENTLYFGRDEVLGVGFDVWVTHRSSPASAFSKPRLVTEFGNTDDNIPSWISNDQCRLYFASNRNATDSGLADFHLWVAERQPK